MRSRIMDKNTELSNANEEAFGRLHQLLSGYPTNVLAVVGAGALSQIAP